jgi:hypothetical protein
MKTNPSPTDPSVVDAGDPNQHSVLVLKEIAGAGNTLFQMQVDSDGRFTEPPVPVGTTDEPTRLVFSLAGATMPDQDSDATVSHVSFGILPIKKDPASVHFSCHLLNADLLHPRNIWTDGPWNVPPISPDRALPPPMVLLAEPNGKITQMTRDGKPTTWTDDLLRQNPAVWRLLRNGCVVGMVQVDGIEGIVELVPLVNLAAFLPAPTGTSKPQAPLTGTWDFKWPKASKIRIRIDEPSETGVTAQNWSGGYPTLNANTKQAAVQRVRDLFDLWLPTAQSPGDLEAVFMDSTHDDYDVLINLDPLAVAQSVPPPPRTQVFAPESQLGTYCQRVPLGIPTSFCGHPEGLKDETGAVITNYYESPAFDHIVLHELGHILGLPHLHQHPAWTEPLVSPSVDTNLAAIIKNVMGIDVAEKTLDSDMRERWPGDAKNYADWPSIPNAGGQGPGVIAGDSIMVGHPIRGVLRDDTGTPRLEYRSAPGQRDLYWLASLYSTP